MIILIAESKTMLTTEEKISEADYLDHIPAGEIKAAGIMKAMSALTPGELAGQTGLSPSLAAKMKQMIYEFPYKDTGIEAIRAYTGVVFKALDYSSLKEDARQRCGRDVAIISSLYGWLRPEDIIKPYRLDFTSKVEGEPVEGRSLNLFWRPDVTKELVRTLQQNVATEILNLLPADAAKCIDWKLVKRFAKVWKVDFQEVGAGGLMKTPAANRLKNLRGKLLRQILQENVSEAKGLISAVSPHYVCEGTPVYPDHLRFLC